MGFQNPLLGGIFGATVGSLTFLLYYWVIDLAWAGRRYLTEEKVLDLLLVKRVRYRVKQGYELDRAKWERKWSQVAKVGIRYAASIGAILGVVTNL